MPFNLKQCHYLVTLADCNSFHQAARTLFITQPTLSIAMKKLEQEMGQPLFQKQGRKAQLTPAGRLALSYARKMLQLERAESPAAEFPERPAYRHLFAVFHPADASSPGRHP